MIYPFLRFLGFEPAQGHYLKEKHLFYFVVFTHNVNAFRIDDKTTLIYIINSFLILLWFYIRKKSFSSPLLYVTLPLLCIPFSFLFFTMVHFNASIFISLHSCLLTEYGKYYKSLVSYQNINLNSLIKFSKKGIN